MSVAEYLGAHQIVIEDYLSNIISSLEAPVLIKEAMAYSLLNGGKRLRSFLCMAFCRLCGGSETDVLPFCGALEMIHAYSLIHDDLPCMDDDDMRRGKPACHIRFGEANALLAGDALLNLAYESVLLSHLPADVCKKGLGVLGKKAGACGMVGGQVLDLAAEESGADEKMLYAIHQGKTAALIEAACMMGVLAGGGSDELVEGARAFGASVGLAFQLTDDILDVSGDEKTLGKPVGSDAKQNKTTFATLYGMEKSAELAAKETEKALQALKIFGAEETVLKDLALWLLQRDH